MTASDHSQANPSRLTVAQASHPGLAREVNEDSFGWFTLPAGELLIVADGIGGAVGGATASKTAVAAFQRFLASASGDPETILKQALLAADQAVTQCGEADATLAGLGSTLVALLLRGPEAWFIHAGDSRLYRWSESELEQLTRDHSYVQELIEAGKITADQAENHEERHIITQSLGGNVDEARLTVGRAAAQPGDVFLLCTDGLYGLVPKEELTRLLTGSASPQAKVRQLLDAALQAGGTDNVTLQLACLPPAVSTSGRITRKIAADSPKASRSRLFFWLLVLIVLAAGGAAIHAWLTRPQAPAVESAPDSAPPPAEASSPMESGAAQIFAPAEPKVGPLSADAPSTDQVPTGEP
jgi:protein phosphatase